MSGIIIVRPAPGRRVLDPASDPPRPLPPDGRRVVRDAYWLRRLKAGEVSLIEVGDAPENPSGSETEQSPAPAAGRRGKKAKEKE